MSPEDPLCSLSLDEYHQSVAVNLTSAFVAAREAVAGFKELPASDAKTFIYSGNKLNVMSDPKTMPFGITKTAAARMVWDCCNVYRDQGLKYVPSRHNAVALGYADCELGFITQSSSWKMAGRLEKLWIRREGQRYISSWQRRKIRVRGTTLMLRRKDMWIFVQLTSPGKYSRGVLYVRHHLPGPGGEVW